MDYVYGQISQKAIKNTYTGASTKTADVIVDNTNSTISVVARLDKEFNNIQNLTDGEGRGSLNQKNSSALGNNSVALGSNSTSGFMAFSVTEVLSDLKTFAFNKVDDSFVGLIGSIYICDLEGNDNNYMLFGKVTEVNGNQVTFDTAIPGQYGWASGGQLKNSYILFVQSTTNPETHEITYTIPKDIEGDTLIGTGALAEGYNTNAIQIGSHSEGINTVALGKYSHAEGRGSVAGGYCSHAEGRDTKTKGMYAFASGRNSEANGDYSFAAIQGKANGLNSLSVGTSTQANGDYSIALGHGTVVAGNEAIGIGQNNTASAVSATAIGSSNTASGNYAAAFNYDNTASGYGASAFGTGTTASGGRSLSFGYNTQALNTTSVAGGASSIANGDSSIAFGTRANSTASNQVVFGKDNATNNNALLIVGDGTSQSAKHNAFEVLSSDVKSNGVSLERTSNKVISFNNPTDTQYPSAKLVKDQLDTKATDSNVVHIDNPDPISPYERIIGLKAFSNGLIVTNNDSVGVYSTWPEASDCNYRTFYCANKIRHITEDYVTETSTVSDLSFPLESGTIALTSDLNNKENTSNKVTSIDASSTDTQYPSAKAVYEYIQSVIPPIYNGGIE